MTYYVYENWTHETARLHLDGCSFCNQGRGIHATDSGRNGKWYGPFADRATAMMKMMSLRRNDTGPCGTCHP
jgi:hypothetical protein